MTFEENRPNASSNHSNNFESHKSKNETDYDQWFAWVRSEFPSKHKGLSCDSTDNFKEVLKSIASLPENVQEEAITNLSAHQGIKKRYLKQWLQTYVEGGQL